MSKKTSLPPLPKLRPRPGLKSSMPIFTDISIETSQQDASIDTLSQHDTLIETSQQEDLEEEEEEEETISPPPMKSRRQTSPINDVIVTSDDSKNDSSEKTSRLLTKNDCRGGGGRKRNSGSLIHSIPKFSQVNTFLDSYIFNLAL